MKIAAVVVTYNRKKLLIECLEALKRQTRPLNAIYIIDNASTDGTSELLFEMGYIHGLNSGTSTIRSLYDGKPIKVVYVRLKENTGGAGGFHEGVKRAYHDGYDWIWLMDDDAEPQKDSLEKLLKYTKDNVAALANLKVDINKNPQYMHRGFFDFENFRWIVRPIKPEELKKDFVKIDHSSFVGILINSNSIKMIGFPKKEFFLHYDDVEYCIRLRKTGDIILVPESLIFHKEESVKDFEERRFLGRKLHIIPYDKLWIYYYGIRNSTWLRQNYMKSTLKFYIILIKSLIFSLIWQLLSNDNILKRCAFILNAYYDGIKSTFDNEKPKKILYK
ncbi:glycosyltransferase family 2 protein [Methanothermobacter tenebrarum]